MTGDGSWTCINCGRIDDIALYSEKLRKPNFLIAPILPTCNSCGSEVELRPIERCDYGNRVLVLTGPIGSGKTSTAEFLFSKYRFNAVDHDCIVDLARHKHNRKVEFNDPEAIAAIEGNLDMLLAFDKDIVLSLVILPSELDTYRDLLRKRNLVYRIFFLCPDYDTVLQRTRTRTCFGSVTPEKWVRHFYEQTEPFRNIEDDDVVLLDNSKMTIGESAEAILTRFS